ncbi:serine/threonine-protein kinase [Paludisphaera sp.]|uniref:serine/threonine-protein kinase n=1 Tax=Paludisphaera sp. TaxID=2017432 RepID=UPI00301CC6DA
MLDPTKTRFWKAALQSGLIDAEGLAACWEAIVPEKRHDEDHVDRRLGRQAVQLKLLTLWQAQQLLAGRSTGFKVDRYVLLDLLGQGGMGRVYLARDSRLGRQVALKILSPERINNPRAIARFQREARVGAQLQHENLVRLYDFGEVQGRHFLVMEYIEGKTLGFHIATQGRLAPEAAARFGRQIALGLDHAHQKGLIHRDVNPYNVIVTHEGVAKLADMGLAMDLADDGKVTRDGATVGTFDYVAPEQARHSHSADIRSDVYSLGCTLYHAMAGQVPFPQPGLAEKLFAHQSREPARLEEQAPGVPTGLADVVRKMMRKDPSERFATPGEVAAALLPFAGGGASEPTALVGARRAGHGSGEGLAASTPDADPAPATAAEAFPFRVDLGPRPSLTESVRNPRARFGGSGSRPSSTSATPSAETGTVAVGSWVGDPARRPWLIAAAALAVVAVGVGVEAARRGKLGEAWPTGGAETIEAKARPATKKAPTIDWGGASAVIRARDGSTRPAPDLSAALEAALGGRGVVVVKGGEPVAIPADAARTLSGRGTIEIEGEAGGAAVLRVELGDKPWISTGSSANLVLRDLTIEVARSASSDQPPPPLFLATGRAKFENCAFRTIPALGYAGSTAVVAKGGALEAQGCWFEGFDAAVEIRAMAGVEHRLRGSMFVPGGTPMEAANADLPVRRGWAARAVFEGGGVRDGRRLVGITRCTIAGEGLLKLEGFPETSPLRVEAVSCAARVERLVDASPPWDPKALAWEGSGNRFDVTGETWATAGVSEAIAATSADWSRLYPERNLDETGVRFSMNGQTPDGRLLPSSYSLLGPGGASYGANPAEVGPRP